MPTFLAVEKSGSLPGDPGDFSRREASYLEQTKGPTYRWKRCRGCPTAGHFFSTAKKTNEKMPQRSVVDSEVHNIPGYWYLDGNSFVSEHVAKSFVPSTIRLRRISKRFLFLKDKNQEARFYPNLHHSLLDPSTTNPLVPTYKRSITRNITAISGN